jgi:hypothetical protein
MKKIILLLLAAFLFIGCAAAQTDQKPLFKVKATVSTIVSDIAILDTSYDYDYQAPAGDLEIYKEYMFLLEIVDCGNCKSRKAIVVWSAITPMQAQKDMNAIPEHLAKRVKPKR